MRSSKRLAVALLATLMAGCGVLSPPPAATPPWALMEDCPEPQAQVKTNGDLVRHIRALRDALRSCNDDKAALRSWADKQ
jgi:hypothetical protein